MSEQEVELRRETTASQTGLLMLCEVVAGETPVLVPMPLTIPNPTELKPVGDRHIFHDSSSMVAFRATWVLNIVRNAW